MHPVAIHYIDEFISDTSKLLTDGYEEDAGLYGKQQPLQGKKSSTFSKEKGKPALVPLNNEIIPPKLGGVEIVVEAIVSIMRKFTLKGKNEDLNLMYGECILVFLSGIGKFV